MRTALRSTVVSGLLTAALLFTSACESEDTLTDTEEVDPQALANCSEIIVDSYNLECYRGTYKYVEHLRRLCGGSIRHHTRVVTDTGQPCHPNAVDP